jgi:DNA invertase Pin-like site-specific DNA recombinase
MILGYIRISTSLQDLKNQKNSINEFARKNSFIVNKFIEVEISSRKNQNERKINEVFAALQENDILIITELSRLGRSLSEILKIVNCLIEKKVKLITIKEGINLQNKHSIQSKVSITMFGLFAELERDLISDRTKVALAAKKAQGVKLGRPKGAGKSKLEPHKEQIQELLDKKVSMLSISKILGVTYPTLFSFIKVRNMKNKKKNNADLDNHKKFMRVQLSLNIENNTKYVRGKKKVIEEIENWILPDYDSAYKKLGAGEYILKVEYKNKKDLDDSMYELLHKIATAADDRHCFSDDTTIQSLDEEDRYWS